MNEFVNTECSALVFMWLNNNSSVFMSVLLKRSKIFFIKIFLSYKIWLKVDKYDQ